MLITTSSPGRFSLALEVGTFTRPTPKSMEKRVGDEVVGIINKRNQTTVTHNKWNMIYVERRTQNSESQMGIVETVTQPLYQAASDWDCFADKFEPSFRRNFLIHNGNRTEWSPIRSVII